MQNCTQNPSENNTLNTPSTEPCRGAISPPKADRQISTLTNYQIKPISKLNNFQISTSLLITIFLALNSIGWGQVATNFSYTGSANQDNTQSFIIPQGVTSITIECWGGGGGGGNKASSKAGAGGGGGGYVRKTITGVSGGQTVSLLIGKGGASASTGYATVATYNGLTTITCTAGGGGAGASGASTAGTAGSGTSVSCTGGCTDYWAGGTGGTGGGTSAGGGGGGAGGGAAQNASCLTGGDPKNGSSAGTSGCGGKAWAGSSGFPSSLDGGSGGASNGGAGGVRGGGGAGASAGGSSGGAGGNGAVRISYTCTAASNTTSNIAICETQTKTLSATPSGGTWSVTAGGGSISGTTYTPANVASNTTVTVRYTLAAGGACLERTSDVSFTVNANAGTANNTTSTAAICETQTKTLSATPSGGTWSATAGGGSISGTTYTPADVASNTTATVRYTIAANGSCAATTSDVSFTVNSNAGTANNTTSTAAICETQTKTLSATPSGGTWSATAGGGSISGTTYTPADVASNTTATVRYTIAANGGCAETTSDVSFTVNYSPTAPSSVTPATTICHGNSLNLNGTSADNTINWYTEATDGTAIQTGVGSGANHSVSPTSNTTYYAEAQSAAGCKSSRTATGLITVENPVSAVNTEIGTALQINDYVWVGQTNSTWSTTSNWRQFDGTNLIAAGSAPGSNNTNRIYVVQNSTSSNCIFNASNLSVGSPLGGTSFFVGTGTSLNLNGQNLNLTGNITINGTFTPGSGTITLSGSANQTLDGASALSFSNLTINKTGGTLTAQKDMTITGTLTLTNGILDMNSKTLTMGTSSANGTITGGSASSYIVALDGTTPSKLIHRVNSTTNETYRFPIGTGSVYTPVTVVMTGGNLSNASIQVWTKNSKVTGMNNGVSCYLNRSWFVEPTGTITNPAYDIQLGFASGDFAGSAGFDLNPVKLSSGVWYKPSGSMLENGTTQGTTIATSYALPSTPATSSGTVYWNNLISFSEFGGAGGSQPLPVELLSFNGACEDGSVNLSWQTASEHNSSHFDIEKSRDGESWQVIETIPASGNSNELLNYTAYDQVTNILNYYRLNQVDIDGTNKRYDPIAVSCEASQNGIFMSYPNPSNEGFNILINDKALEGEMNMNVYTATGSITLQKRIEVKEGINVFMVNEKLLPGLYFIELKDQNNNTKMIRHLIN